MKKILGYAAVGVVSAATTFGLIQLTTPEMPTKNNDSLVSIAQNDEQATRFASYDYASAGTVMPDFTQAASKSVNAVVSIQTYGATRNQGRPSSFDFFNDPFFDQFFSPRRNLQRDENQPSGAGSGVIISQDGYIVTNNHVIEGAKKIQVTLNSQESYTATLVGTDPNTDIALIKIDEDQLPFLKFYNSDNLNVGEWVLAVGNPFGLNSTVTAGIVSAKGRGIGILSQNGDHPIESFIQTDAAINPGNSGGALVNTAGHLVGINTAIYSKTGSYAGYGFAVPANLAKKIVDDIRNYGRVQRGYIGINGLDLTDEDLVRNYNAEFDKQIKTQQGVMVLGLTENGGALEAGIEEGDIIKSIDGKAVKSFASLTALVGSKNPGDKVQVTVLRDKRERSYDVVLKDLQGNAKVRSVDELTVAERLGARFEPLTKDQKMRYGIDKGVLVSDITSNGKLRAIGVQAGYIILKVNGKEVDSGKDIEKLLSKYEGNVSINFVDRRGRIYTQGFEMN